jgi:FAD/FMN-containing dehydrogenase
MTHDERVAEIAARVRARRGVASLGKKAVSHFVPNARDARHRDDKIDITSLVHILDIDVEARTCTAESGVTFSDLVRATLPHGLAPKLVPELETITIGGAVSGCAVESMAHRHGGFHDSCLAYEVLTGEGEIVTCSRGDDTFDMMHGSYGTLGILTKLTFEIVPAKPFVHVEYQRFTTWDEFSRAMWSADADFIDGIAHAADSFVLCLGRFVDEAPEPSSYTGTSIYWKSTLGRREDWLTTYDYFFRYDTDCHWTSRTIPFMQTKIGRALAGPFVLGSTNMLAWSKRLAWLFALQKRLPVVIDLFVPRAEASSFCDWYTKTIGWFPMWIVPYRVPSPYPWLTERFRGADQYVDFAVYGLPNDRPGIDLSEALERRVHAHGGIKTLISENHYDEASFWQVYDRDRYAAIKRAMDPRGIFRDVFDKMVLARQVKEA